MGKTMMGAVVSLDGFMADNNDGVGPLFDWLGNGDVGSTCRAPTASSGPPGVGRLHARRVRRHGCECHRATAVRHDQRLGRRAGRRQHVFVVTHQPPTDWEYADTAPFTFVNGVRRRSPPPRSSPATGSSTWPPVSRRPGAHARADRPGGRQPGPGGLRLRPPVLRHRRPGRAAAAGEPKHDRGGRPRHPPALRRQPLAVVPEEVVHPGPPWRLVVLEAPVPRSPG